MALRQGNAPYHSPYVENSKAITPNNPAQTSANVTVRFLETPAELKLRTVRNSQAGNAISEMTCH